MLATRATTLRPRAARVRGASRPRRVPRRRARTTVPDVAVAGAPDAGKSPPTRRNAPLGRRGPAVGREPATANDA